MGLIKCPRCELNYIQEGEKCCNVCRRGMRDDPDPEELGMCPECGERPVMRGREICIVCHREHLRQQKLENLANQTENGEPIDLLDVDSLDEMEDLDVAMNDEIPESEYEEIHRELGGDDEDTLDAEEDLDTEDE